MALRVKTSSVQEEMKLARTLAWHRKLSKVFYVVCQVWNSKQCIFEVMVCPRARNPSMNRERKRQARYLGTNLFHTGTALGCKHRTLPNTVELPIGRVPTEATLVALPLVFVLCVKGAIHGCPKDALLIGTPELELAGAEMRTTVFNALESFPSP